MNLSRLFYLIFIYSGIFIPKVIASSSNLPSGDLVAFKTQDLLANWKTTRQEAYLPTQNSRCIAYSKKT